MCCHHQHSPDSKSFFKIGLGIIGSLVIIGAGYGYWNNLQAANAELSKYSPEDIAKERPIRAEHIHGRVGHIGESIPFLPKDQPQPKISVSQTSYDFGTIGPRDIVKQTFILRNAGEGTLTISNAYTTCGCTTADFSASAIPPGKVALITVTFDAGFHDTRGQTVQRGIIIENNDPNQSQVEIWVTASIRQS
jgi:hypothetical protein